VKSIGAMHAAVHLAVHNSLRKVHEQYTWLWQQVAVHVVMSVDDAVGEMHYTRQLYTIWRRKLTFCH
jgi:hypothetical protein